MKKVLFTATVDSHINHFHLPYLKMFKDNGYEVHVATNTNERIDYCDVKHKVSFEKSPFKINNLKAIKEMKKILNKEKFDIIHTHTPMGATVTRIAAKKTRKENKTRVIYTAHGFHFFKGAPVLNWLLFYPVEKILSKYTDTLITINKEDYELAKDKFKCNVEYVPGVGIDSKKFNFEMTEEEKIELRESLNCDKDSFIMIFPAELSKRKNQGMLIKAMKELIKENDNIHLLLPGKDLLNGKYQKQVKELNLDNNIHFLGYRKDIPKLLKISDIAVSSSKQEGLPVNIMEAMFCKLPCVVTDCRGNRDLVENDKNGYIVDIDDIGSMVKKVIFITYNKFQSLKLVDKYYQTQIFKQFLNIYKLQLKLKEISNIEKPLVSVIIPVYNGEKYIEKCVNSILNQTYSNIEIIICDDCSSDNSYNLIKKLKDLNKKKIVIIKNKKNMKSAYTRNKCIQLSTGKYIAIQDIDDYSNINRIETQVNILESENISYVSTGMLKFDNDRIGEDFYIDKEYPRNKDFLWGLPYIHGSTMFIRVALEDVGFYSVSNNMQRTEDFELFIKLHLAGHYGKNIKECMYFCNEDIENYKRRKYKYRIDEFFMRLKAYKKFSLMPIGYIYSLKPLIVGLFPYNIQYFLKRRLKNLSRGETCIRK